MEEEEKSRLREPRDWDGVERRRWTDRLDGSTGQKKDFSVSFWSDVGMFQDEGPVEVRMNGVGRGTWNVWNAD